MPDTSEGTTVVLSSVFDSSKGGFVCRGLVNCRPMKIKQIATNTHFNFFRITNISYSPALKGYRSPGARHPIDGHDDR